MKGVPSFGIHPIPTSTSPWRIGLLWLTSSVFAWVGANLIVTSINGGAAYLLALPGLIGGAIAATVLLSMTQWYLLRPVIPSGVWWVVSSSLAALGGVIAGFIVGVGTGFVGFLLIDLVIPFELPEPGSDVPIFGMVHRALAVGGAMGGALVGTVQRALIRRTLPGSWWWVGAWAGGSAVGMVVFLLAGDQSLLRGVLSGMSYGSITSPVVILMARGVAQVRP